jgi:hypothetical protein
MLDMAAYDRYFAGDIVDYELPDEVIAKSMATVPVIG